VVHEISFTSSVPEAVELIKSVWWRMYAYYGLIALSIGVIIAYPLYLNGVVRDSALSVKNKFYSIRLGWLSAFYALSLLMILVFCALHNLGYNIFMTNNITILSISSIFIAAIIRISFFEYMFPSSIFCPHCSRAIFIRTDWQCANCGNVHSGYLLNAGCKKCGSKLTAVDCPGCRREIDFSKGYK